MIGWRIYMDYRKLNTPTKNNHFLLSFINQMLDRLAGNKYYYFLDGYYGYSQITIAPEDQHKTTFTRLYITFFDACPLVCTMRLGHFKGA